MTEPAQLRWIVLSLVAAVLLAVSAAILGPLWATQAQRSVQADASTGSDYTTPAEFVLGGAGATALTLGVAIEVVCVAQLLEVRVTGRRVLVTIAAAAAIAAVGDLLFAGAALLFAVGLAATLAVRRVARREALKL